MSGPSPGPWRVACDPDHFHTMSDVVDKDGRPVAAVGGAYENIEANARLIAAAPDLLAALREMCGWVEWLPAAGRESYERAMAIIERATGGGQ